MFAVYLVVGFIVGFLVAKFWYSRKINATVDAVKSNPLTALDKIKEIWGI